MNSEQKIITYRCRRVIDSEEKIKIDLNTCRLLLVDRLDPESFTEEEIESMFFQYHPSDGVVFGYQFNPDEAPANIPVSMVLKLLDSKQWITKQDLFNIYSEYNDASNTRNP